MGPPGPPGDTGGSGPMGPVGPKGDPGESCICNSIVVSEDYTANKDDYYIGVNSTGPVTITLPTEITNCGNVIVKAEMGPPLGNRKVTVTAPSGSTIDGVTNKVITVPYGLINLHNSNSNWFTI